MQRHSYYHLLLVGDSREGRDIEDSLRGWCSHRRRPDETIWTEAAVLPLQPAEVGTPFPAAGEMRVVVRRGYLCLSARVPETGRIVAKSTGRDPRWVREDQVVWRFRYNLPVGGHRLLTLIVNPLGAYSVELHGPAVKPHRAFAPRPRWGRRAGA